MSEQNKEGIKRRPIRSYILRQGRITAAQTKAIQENLKKHAIVFENQLVNFNDVFKNSSRELILEIGFGMGTSTAEIAKANPKPAAVSLTDKLVKHLPEGDINLQPEVDPLVNLPVYFFQTNPACEGAFSVGAFQRPQIRPHQ